MRTALYCPGCGKRCGSAETLAEDVDLVHVTMYNQRRRGPYSGLDVHVTRGRTSRLSESEGWPMTWECEHCKKGIGLSGRAAGRVGRAKRILLDSMPLDN